MPLHYFPTSELPTSKCDFTSSFTVCDPVAVSRSRVGAIRQQGVVPPDPMSSASPQQCRRISDRMIERQACMIHWLLCAAAYPDVSVAVCAIEYVRRTAHLPLTLTTNGLVGSLQVG